MPKKPASKPAKSADPIPPVKRTVQKPAARSRVVVTDSEPKTTASSLEANSVKSAPAKRAPRAANVSTPLLKVPAAVVIKCEDVSLRAYYLAEERQRKGLPGSPEQDWIEAERQIRAEAIALQKN